MVSIFQSRHGGMSEANEVVMTQPDQISQPEYIEDEINLIDYFLVLLKHKRMIFWIVVLAIVLSVVVSLFLPKMYTATARVLPPQ